MFELSCVTSSVMRNAHSGLPKCSSQLYEMDMPISALQSRDTWRVGGKWMA